MTTRQIVYRYPPGESGSGQFAVWHLGAPEVTVYYPEGQTLKVLPLEAATRADADQAARSHREVVSVTESDSLYPGAS